MDAARVISSRVGGKETYTQRSRHPPTARPLGIKLSTGSGKYSENNLRTVLFGPPVQTKK